MDSGFTMHEEKLPGKVFLNKVDSGEYEIIYDHLKRLNIDICETNDPADLTNNGNDEDIPIALSFVSNSDYQGIVFLRSMISLNHLIQRIIVCNPINFDIIEQAVNQAHINYLIKYPLEEQNFKKYLIKANERFLYLTRPFNKFDALTKITQGLLVDVEKFRKEATTDPLTGLMNRRSFDNILSRIWKRHKQKGLTFSISLLDIDFFKKVNDTYGHAAGDKVLKSLGEILLKNQRLGMDYTFRYGGEEFAIISTNTDRDEMKQYMARLLNKVRTRVFKYNSNKISITFSAGVCQAENESTIADLIIRADTALYEAKQSGRNKIIVPGSDKLHK